MWFNSSILGLGRGWASRWINSYGGAVGTTCEYDIEFSQMGLFYCKHFDQPLVISFFLL